MEYIWVLQLHVNLDVRCKTTNMRGAWPGACTWQAFTIFILATVVHIVQYADVVLAYITFPVTSSSNWDRSIGKKWRKYLIYARMILATKYTSTGHKCYKTMFIWWFERQEVLINMKNDNFPTFCLSAQLPLQMIFDITWLQVQRITDANRSISGNPKMSNRVMIVMGELIILLLFSYVIQHLGYLLGYLDE